MLFILLIVKSFEQFERTRASILMRSIGWMVEINTFQDVRNCMNATRLPSWCEFHAEVMITVARGRPTTKRRRCSRYRIQKGARANGSRCLQQTIPINLLELEQDLYSHSPGRLLACGCHVEDDEDMSIPSSIRRAFSFFLVKFCRYAIYVRKLRPRPAKPKSCDV